MAEVVLTQAEADALLQMEKRRVNETVYLYPAPGHHFNIPLASLDGREAFVLDVRRASINISKVTHQQRGCRIVVLARLDLGGAPHRNPDDTVVACPHLHVYREGYADKWAVAVPPQFFHDTDDLARTLDDFMNYCHIVEPPALQRGF